MEEVVIVDTLRTPRGRGKPDGALHSYRPIKLAAIVLEEILKRNPNCKASDIGDVILGCVTQTSLQGGCIAKMAALMANMPESVPGQTINRFCGSGLETVNQASSLIKSGTHQVVMAGGVESMSRVPIGSDGGAWFSDPELIMHHRLVPQGISADLIATLKNYSREKVDEFALLSQKKAQTAEEKGHFKKSRLVLKDDWGNVVLDREEHIRAETTLQNLAKLKASFAQMGELYGMDAMALGKYPSLSKINHVHHAGNSSGIVDGAASVLLASKTYCKKNNIKGRGRIVSWAITSGDPTIMLTGPAPASREALKRASLKAQDIDVFEVNEAFASVVLNFIDEMNVNPEKINPNGGAIAMGHPLGATGAMLLGTCLDELERINGRYGLITLCIGGGMGIATIIERI